MKKVTMFKMPFVTGTFKKGQKVWVQKFTGNTATKVYGKFRGFGRPISVWINWEKKRDIEWEYPELKEIEVEDEFAQRNKLWIEGHD